MAVPDCSCPCRLIITARKAAAHNPAPLDEQPLEAPGDMDATLLRRHAAKVLREAISDLTEDQQQVIILRFIEGQRIETGGRTDG